MTSYTPFAVRHLVAAVVLNVAFMLGLAFVIYACTGCGSSDAGPLHLLRCTVCTCPMGSPEGNRPVCFPDGGAFDCCPKACGVLSVSECLPDGSFYVP